jgi:hypothetical protein
MNTQEIQDFTPTGVGDSGPSTIEHIELHQSVQNTSHLYQNCEHFQLSLGRFLECILDASGTMATLNYLIMLIGKYL